MYWFIRYYFKLKPLYELLEKQNKKYITFFVDIQNISRGLYSSKSLEYYYYSKDSNLYFEEIIRYINWLYSKFKKYEPYIVIFADSGKSKYHHMINEDYKAHRRDGSFFTGVSNTTEFTSADLLNILIHLKKVTYEKLFEYQAKTDYMSFIYLHLLETDFIPHYIIRNNLIETNTDDNINILLSVDKDILQTTKFKNTYQLIIRYHMSNKKTETLLFDNSTAYKYLIKDLDKKGKYQIGAEYIPLILAIAGDSSDNIQGIKGYGYKKAIQLIKQTNLAPDLSNINEIENPIVKKYKLLIEKNYSLTSFDKLIDSLPFKYKNLIHSLLPK